MSFSFQFSAVHLLAAQVVAQHGHPVVRLSPLEAMLRTNEPVKTV